MKTKTPTGNPRTNPAIEQNQRLLAPPPPATRLDACGLPLPALTKPALVRTFEDDVAQITVQFNCEIDGGYEVAIRCSAIQAEFAAARERAKTAFVQALAGATWPIGEREFDQDVVCKIHGWFIEPDSLCVVTTVGAELWQGVSGKDAVTPGMDEICRRLLEAAGSAFLGNLGALGINLK